ncbi:tyrosine-type recombinase/integrase [Sphingomonas montanisoli]|uniref:DUF4102 domain-containing protein n=1 Tax=Sphingomonas montanisoli TaxID=2606412 RepID=A0A5D9CH73_9SPHN|nr:integrase arm-type DNA-binding domain-containing protein [Sphingomonas montanisoli]TZG29461.1 DUF4102 domain-containing protein [Sphingomonas montanisoli]
MALSPLEVSSAKPGPSPYKLSDEKGLFLLVQPSGARLWRLKYRIHKVDRKLSLGAYPEVSLKQARDRRDEARRMVGEGIDPVAVRRREKLSQEVRAATTFRLVAYEYLEKMEAEERSEATMKKARWFRDLLDRDIGPLPAADITPQELFAALRKIERRGHRETANRTRAFASRVFRYAIVSARAETKSLSEFSSVPAVLAPVADIRMRGHARNMRWQFVALLSVALGGCSSSVPDATSLCDLPRSLAGWSGATVRWKGLIVNAQPHGISLISEDCRHRGVTIIGFSREAGAQYALLQQRSFGWAWADLTGKVVSGGLRIESFHRVASLSGEEAYQRARRVGF